MLDQLPPEGQEPVAQPASPEGAVTPVVAPPATPTAPDATGLVEKLRNELRAEFQQQLRSMQSKSDRAYAAALRDAKVVDEIAAATGLEPERVAAAKRVITDKRFGEIFDEPVPQAQPQYLDKVWTKDELALAAKTEYQLDPADFDVSNWAGLRNDDPRGKEYHEAAKKAQAAKAAKAAATATAQGVAQARDQYGRTVPGPGGAAGASATSITKQLEDVLNLPPTGDVVERNRRKVEADRLELELEKYENSTRISPYEAYLRSLKPPQE